MSYETKLSKQLRGALKDWSPLVSVNQIENKVETSGADYTLVRSGKSVFLELKVDKSRHPGEVQVKFQPGQLNRLNKECRRDNPAWVGVHSADVFYLVPPGFFDGEGRVSESQLLECAHWYWPLIGGPDKAALRDMVRYLFD